MAGDTKKRADRKKSAEPLDTLNSNGVTTHQGQVVLFKTGQTLAPEDALRLAAWLIVGAELAGFPGDVVATTFATVEAIRAT